MDLKQNNLTKKAMKVSSGALAALSVFSNSAFALSPNDILKKAKTMVVPAVVTTATAAAAVSVLGLTGVLIWKIPSLMSEKTEVVVSDELIGGIANKIDLATKEKMLTSFDEVRECLGLKKDEKGIFSKLKEDLDTNINKDEYREKFEDNCGCFFSSVRLLLGEKLFPGKNKTGKNKNGKLSESEKSFLNDVVGKIKAAVLAKSKNKNDVDGAASDLTKPSGDQNSNQQLEQKSAQLSAPAEVEVAEVPAVNNSTQENTAANEAPTDENKSENVEEANKKTAEENSASVENKVKEEVAVDKKEIETTPVETPVEEKLDSVKNEVKEEVKKDADVKKETETAPVEMPASVNGQAELKEEESFKEIKLKEDEAKNVNEALGALKVKIDGDVNSLKMDVNPFYNHLYNNESNNYGYVIRLLDIMISSINADSSRLSKKVLSKVVEGKSKRGSFEEDLKKCVGSDLICKIVSTTRSTTFGALRDSFNGMIVPLIESDRKGELNEKAFYGSMDSSIKESLYSVIESLSKLIKIYCEMKNVK